MALEDILVLSELIDHGRECGVNLYAGGHAVAQVARRNIILLRLDIQQMIDGDGKVVAAHVGVVDGDGDVALLIGSLVEQVLHSLAQAAVVVDEDGQHGHNETDNECPLQKHEKHAGRDGIVEEGGEGEEIADGDKCYQSQCAAPVVPYPPGFYAFYQWRDDAPPVQCVATGGDESEHGGYQALVALIHAEPEGLQQKQYRPDEHTIGDTVFKPMPTLLERICASEY